MKHNKDFCAMLLFVVLLGTCRCILADENQTQEHTPTIEEKILGTPVSTTGDVSLPSTLSKGERFSDQVLGVIRVLKDKITKLETDRDYDREQMRELERRTVENQDDTFVALTDLITVKQNVQEIQDRLRQLENNVEEYRAHMLLLQTEQEQQASSTEQLRKLKENTRRNFRKVDKNSERLSLRFEALENEIKNISKNLGTVQNECQIKTHLNREYLIDLERTIENRTKFYHSDSFKRLKSRIEENSSLNLPLSSIQITEGSGEPNTEYILSPLPNGPSRVEGSGEEVIDVPVVLPHSHLNYLNVEDFLLEIQERDDTISGMEQTMSNLQSHVERLEGRVASIQLGDFMSKLQESLVNFTQNVITLDQWKMASTDIVNSTQLNQQQITSLTNMILNNTNYLRDLEWKVSDVQALGFQQFNLLRMYVIQMNNTLQDLKEYHNRQHHDHVTNVNTAQAPSASINSNTIPQQNANREAILSRIEDLALQIIYNENRISKLEIRVLNESLFDCNKYTRDINQDSKMNFLERDITQLIEAQIIIKEMIKRLDHGLFQVHSKNNNQTEVINNLVTGVLDLQGKIETVDDIQRDVDFVKFMLPIDCHEYYQRGYQKSGIYVIRPASWNDSIKVFCDMEEGIGGWTVFQKRLNGHVDFTRNWADYKDGFGHVESEFWLGNDLLHLLTANQNHSLKIDMVDIDDKVWRASFDNFQIESENTKYKIHISGFSGNCTDSLSYSDSMGFSTFDQDNDASSTHCAMYYTAGWWYKHCHYSNLNGRYQLGMVWYNHEREEWIQLKSSTMKIKPNHS